MKEQNRELAALIEKIRHDRGFDGSHYKPSFLKRRLLARMRTQSVTSFGAYQALLDADPDEYPRLMSALTINLSYFYRDGEVFLSIRDDILAPLIQQRATANHHHLSIWSAGCASGEEPYSIAILLWELLGSELEQWRLQILGTDVDVEALSKARGGIFNSHSFRGVNGAFLAPYFAREGKGYLVRSELRHMVAFRQHDLTSHTPPCVSSFDLILCRNVLIYFSRQQQAQVLSALHQALRSEGHLVLGKTEFPLVNTSNLFHVTNSRLHIYHKVTKEDT